MTYIQDRNGQVLNDDKQIMNRWKEYFEQFLEFPLKDEKETEELRETEPKRETENDIQEGEIIIKLRKLKCGKAPGFDAMSPEILKYIGYRAIKELTKIYNMAWKRKILVVPVKWKNAIIVYTHKKGNPQKCENYYKKNESRKKKKEFYRWKKNMA